MSDGFEFPVDATAILTFAGALGETNPVYHDEAYARGTPLGGVIAPPTFGIAAAHWNPRHFFRGVRRIPAAAPPPGEAGADAPRPERGEGGPVARILHGEQRFEYHRPLRPGMRLRVETRPGKSWEKEGRRGGRLRFSESVSEYRDEAGELVLTATSVGIVTAKAVEG
jgi:acyl dehydratase